MNIHNVLLLDLGSTNIKWAIYNKKKGFIFSNNISFPKEKKLPKPYFEVSLSEILEKVVLIIYEAESLFNIKSIYISTQMHGYVLGNENYQPITDYISWQDERGLLLKTNYYEQFKDVITKAYGVDIKPNLPRLSIYAISKLNKEKYRNAKVFFTLGSYLIYYLIGKNHTHITDAAPSGFYNIVEKTKDDYELVLPDVSYNVEFIGKYKNIKIFTPVGDQQASVYGVNKSDSYILNLGTAAQLCTVSADFITGDFESRPYFNNKILCTVTRLFGGKKIIENYNKNLEELLFENYINALTKLPRRSKLIITGGVVKYQRELIENVVKKFNIKYSFNEDYDSLNGLAKLAEVCDRYE